MLTRHIVEHALALRGQRAVWFEELAALARLPLGEVTASPFGLRMIALGVARGATSVHHELRTVLTPHVSLRDPDAPDDPLHGQWAFGALRTGKYQQFTQDEPFCTYQPAYGAKWAPHEMLHRAVSFVGSALTPFERYLEARLTELLPTATWYGLEHALRLEHRGPFDRVAEGQSLRAPRELARWLDEPKSALERRAREAVPLVRFTLEHVARELAVLDRERATRVLEASPIMASTLPASPVRLDGSSDAIAYVRGHRQRLDAPATRAAHARAVRDGDALPSLDALRDHVEDTLDALLFDEVTVDRARTESAIARRHVLDLELRAALVAPSLTGSSPSSRALTMELPRGELERVRQTGLVVGDVAQLARGVSELHPGTAEYLDDDVIPAFAESTALFDRAPLGDRLARFLDEGGVPRPLLDLLAIERTACRVVSPQAIVDHEATTSPSASEDAHLVLDPRYACVPLTYDLARFEEGRVVRRARAVLVSADEALELPRALAARLSAGPLAVSELSSRDRSIVDELVERGVLAWRSA